MKVGRYEVTGFLGRGGMAEVFQCSLSGIGGFDKTIVVKRMLPNLIGDPQFVQMFLDEARLVARLSHPNIVQVFEVGEMEGVPFLAMEYLEGPTLRQVIRQVRQARSQNLGHMVKILSGIALALDYAHNAKDTTGESLGIVHRDVSPHNIIVSTQGVSKLLDFGVAKAEGRLSQTKGSSMKGKLAYMAPEQTEGQVDLRTDIFSLGVCLYEASLLRRPFRGNNEAEVLQAVIKGAYPRPREVVPAFPERLEEIIGWAMQADPDARCPSARILHNALENFISRGEYPSDPEGLQAWLGELFPDPSVYAPQALGAAWDTAGSQDQGSGSLPGSGSASMSSRLSGSFPGLGDSQLTPSRSVIIERRSALPWVITLIAVAAAAGVGGMLYMKSQARPQDVAPSLAGLADGDDEAARRFLQEIDRLLEEKKYAMALDLSKKVAKLDVKDAELEIHRAHTLEAAETAGFLAMARMALEGGDTRGAIEQAKKVLERDFENEAARALILQARGSKIENPVIEEVMAPQSSSHLDPLARRAPPRGRRAKKAGTVSLSSTPEATIYVDDLPVGRTPIAALKLTPGDHLVEFRAEGHEAVTRKVKIRAGKSRRLSVDLPGVAAPVKAPPEVLEAPPVAPPKPVPVPVAVASAPEPEATVEKSAPTAPAKAAPAPEKPGKPRLPEIYTLRSRKDIARVFGVIEKEIIARGHVPRARAKNLTAPLARALYATFAPGTTVDVYPQGMYWIAVDLHLKGERPAQIAAAITRAHTSGRVRSYRPKAR